MFTSFQAFGYAAESPPPPPVEEPRPAQQLQSQQRKDEVFPGWGLPVNYTPKIDTGNRDERRGRFQNAIQDWNGSPLCVREITMVGVMRELMEKPEWDRKVFDEQIIAKWRKEALQNFNLSEIMWDYCLAELQDKAKSFQQTGIVSAIDFDCKVVYSDRALSSDEAQALFAAIAPLENVPEKSKDWHPGSNGQILDLVHPSLYPLVYGLSRVLSQGRIDLEDCLVSIGKGEVIPVPAEQEVWNMQWYNSEATGDPDIWSGRFQWLPCDVSFSDDERVSITSYINNLHPKHHKNLYGTIENVIAKSIPLWNEVLASTESGKTPRLDIKDWSDHWPRGEERPRGWRPEEWEDNNPRGTKIDENGDEVTDDEDEDFDGDELYDEWRRSERRTKHPEPQSPYSPPAAPEARQIVDMRKLFEKTGLQVIVKLANIHLTPEKPTYAGGTWHIEGQLNEHIVATSLFYYDQENIDDSSIAFRQVMDTESGVDIPYEQYEFHGIEEVLGIQNEEAAFSDLGSVLTKEGRLLAFPNVLQHRVPPFSTRDPSRPGHRKILALFLVDPYIRILSTSKVPPQQKDWWVEEVIGAAGNIDRLSNMPAETMGQILDDCDGFPISLEEAKGIRAELMKERSRIQVSVEEGFKENQFNFCEH